MADGISGGIGTSRALWRGIVTAQPLIEKKVVRIPARFPFRVVLILRSQSLPLQESAGIRRVKSEAADGPGEAGVIADHGHQPCGVLQTAHGECVEPPGLTGGVEAVACDAVQTGSAGDIPRAFLPWTVAEPRVDNLPKIEFFYSHRIEPGGG